MYHFLKIKGIIALTFIICNFSSSLYATPPKGKQAISNAWELPPLILNDLDGQKHNLYEWHGKVIMLNFWATWCGPCLIEIPEFIEFQTHYGKQGLQIIGIGLDEERKLRNFVRTTGINYPILQADPELQYSLLKQWGNSFGILPFTVVIAQDGHLVFMQQGILTQETFNTIIKPLLKQE
ncbi:MAG: redoxin domain-containing protein [Methyloprofundus sp.]|nr:redoxin domain-containing protein [Methyloprofundus sp.]